MKDARKGNGGARPGAGLAKDCAGPVKVRQVTIDDERADKARSIGGGNLSRGIRRAIDAASLPSTASATERPTMGHHNEQGD